MEQRFTLYTWQLPDWDITKENRDPSKGPLRWEEDTWDRLQPLYKKLEEKVGTLDFLWCYPAYEYWKQYKISRLWVLDVPSLEIFKFFDSKIWEVMFDCVDNNKQPEDIHWDQLIVEKSEGIKMLSSGNKNDITPVILVPISPLIRVIDKSRFNKGPNHSNARYEDLPTSVCEAKKCRNERPKPGSWRQRRKGRNSLS